MRCPRCGRENPEGELFCVACQQRLPRLPQEIYGEMYRDQESRRRARWRRDVVIGVIWGLSTGIGTLALALSLDAEGGDRMVVALGMQLWWFVGISWGLGVWWFRRMSASET